MFYGARSWFGNCVFVILVLFYLALCSLLLETKELVVLFAVYLCFRILCCNYFLQCPLVPETGCILIMTLSIDVFIGSTTINILRPCSCLFHSCINLLAVGASFTLAAPWYVYRLFHKHNIVENMVFNSFIIHEEIFIYVKGLAHHVCYMAYM